MHSHRPPLREQQRHVREEERAKRDACQQPRVAAIGGTHRRGTRRRMQRRPHERVGAPGKLAAGQEYRRRARHRLQGSGAHA